MFRNNFEVFRVLQLKRVAMAMLNERCQRGFSFLVADLMTRAMRYDSVQLSVLTIEDVFSCGKSSSVLRRKHMDATESLLETTMACMTQDAAVIAFGVTAMVMIYVARKY